MKFSSTTYQLQLLLFLPQASTFFLFSITKQQIFFNYVYYLQRLQNAPKHLRNQKIVNPIGHL